MSNLSVNLQNFFPSKELYITNILEDTKRIPISLKSKANKYIYPECNTISTKHHGTYIRKVQDLPMLAK